MGPYPESLWEDAVAKVTFMGGKSDSDGWIQ